MDKNSFEFYVWNHLKSYRAHGAMALINGYDDYEEKSVYKLFSTYGEDILEQLHNDARSAGENIFQYLSAAASARAPEFLLPPQNASYPNHNFYKALVVTAIDSFARKLEKRAN